MHATTLQRCPWVDLGKPDYVAYHDEEWGVPVVDDRQLFELLVLEGAQAGLSWYTILRKRAAYRRAFAGFDIAAVAAFDERDVARLLGDAGIVRHRQKIAAAIGNARAALAIIAAHGTLARYLWSFVDGRVQINAPAGLADYAVTSPAATAMSNGLRAAGCRFVGPTTLYAFMQAAGFVNDHARDCHRQAELATTTAGRHYP